MLASFQKIHVQRQHTKNISMARDVLQVGRPVLQLELSLIENVSRLLGTSVSRVRITRHDWRVIQQHQQSPSLTRQQNLLLRTLNRRRHVHIIRLLELLSRQVRQLRLRNQTLRLSPDQLLLELPKLRRIGILILELLDVISDLLLVVARRLHTALSVPDALEQAARLLEVLRKEVFLLGDFGEEDAELVGDVAEGVVVGLFAPLGELGGDGGALAAGVFVGADDVGFGFDELVELLGEVLFGRAAETAR